MNDDWLGPKAAEGAPAYQGPSFADEEPGGGRPLLATAICCGFLILSVAASVREVPELPVAIGAQMVFGAMMWGIAYAATIRRSTRAWKIGSFAIVMVVAVLAALVRVGGSTAALRDDAASAANEMERVLASSDPENTRMRAGGGPLSQMMAAFLNGVLEDSSRFEREAAAAGVEQVLTQRGLTRSSPVLRNCGRIAALSPLADSLAGNVDRHLAAAHAIGERAIASGEMPRAALNGFENGAQSSKGDYRRQWALNAQLGSEAAALCRLLAKGRWRDQNGRIGFDSDADVAVFNRGIERIRAIGAEQERMSREGAADARRSLQEMRGGR